MNNNALSKNSLGNHITNSLHDYFSNLDGEPTSGVYQLVLQEVEISLLKTVMHYTKGNQSRAANWLGLNRGTLRKLLCKYGLE